MANIRLDKYIADSGAATRGEVKKLIKGGKAVVNGKIIKDGSVKVDPEKDEVVFCGKNIGYDKLVYIMLNKPAGVVSATEDRNDKTVIDLLEAELKNRNLFPVGRLDKDTVGLLILTNDGDFAHKTLSPKKHVDKIYVADIDGELPSTAEESFKNGIDIGDHICKSATLEVVEKRENGASVKVCISEGKFHQVKRMFEALGCKVVYLKRMKFGEIELDETLKEGEYRPLNAEEMKYVAEVVG